MVIAQEETICLATYGGAVTSVPSPGRDILIQVGPISGPLAPRGSSDQGYLDSTGQIQITCQAGSIFRLVSGLLFFDGDQISVPKNVPEQRLKASAHIEAIDSIFAIAGDGTLVWNNDAFDHGTARFGSDSAGLYGVFHGMLPSQLTAVFLRAMDPSECLNLTQSLSSIPIHAPSSGIPVFPASYTNTTRSVFSTPRASSSTSASWTLSSRHLHSSASSVSSNVSSLMTASSTVKSSSENVVKPTQLSIVTATSASTVIPTSYSTQSFATLNNTIVINATSTTIFGNYSSTVKPFTANVSQTTTGTTTSNVTSNFTATSYSPTVVLASPTMLDNNTINAPNTIGNNITNFTSVTATFTNGYNVTATSGVTTTSSQCTLGSTYIAADDSTNFAESCNTDFVGYEADSSVGVTFEACMDQCAQMNDDAYGSCIGISHDRTNLTCSLKYGILVEQQTISTTIDSARITNQGSCIDGVTQWGGIFLPSNGDSYTIFCAINDPGFDTAPQWSSGANSTDTCAQACTTANNAGGINAGTGDVPCVGAAYVPHYSAEANCCLKTAIPPDNFATRAYIVDTARLNPQG